MRLIIRICQSIYRELKRFFHQFLAYFPGQSGNLIRSVYWGKAFARCGSNVFIDIRPNIIGEKNISLGEQVTFGPDICLYAHPGDKITVGDRLSTNKNVMIDACNGGEIIIGNDVLIGPNVVIRASNHNFSSLDIPIRSQGHSGGKIVIEDDVWIAANVVVLPNVTIGTGSVIAAGAIVTKSIPPYSIAAGVPAKVVKKRI